MLRCLLLCKDRNFKANHNTLRQIFGNSEDVCYSAKIGILKQITTGSIIFLNPRRCLLLCKDRNFKANHNSRRLSLCRQSDVCYSAKIGILKQITTPFNNFKTLKGCLLLCKDRNFKANHNTLQEVKLAFEDVCYSAKIGILKQITTIHNYCYSYP